MTVSRRHELTGDDLLLLTRRAVVLFEYVSGPSGVSSISALHSGWGTKFFDYDNDGWKDIFVAQGHVMDNIELTQPDVLYEEPLVLMRNTGKNFVDVSESSGPPFQVRRSARGAAIGDLDNDGFLDIVVNCNDHAALVLRNEGSSNNWLIVDTVGGRSNRDGIGSQIRLVLASGDGDSGKGQFAIVSTAGSYLSSGLFVISKRKEKEERGGARNAREG